MDAVAGPMLRQLKQLGMDDVKFMGGDGICSGELLKLAGDAIGTNKVYCAEAGGVSGDQVKAMDEFKARFKAKYNVDVQIYAPYVYDAVNTLVAAMQKANSVDPKAYLPELAKIQYKGVTGNIAFDERGDIKDGALTLFTYKPGSREQMRVVR